VRSFGRAVAASRQRGRAVECLEDAGRAVDRSDFTPREPTDEKYSRQARGGIRDDDADREQFDPGRARAAPSWAIRRVAAGSLVVRGPAWDERFGRPRMREAIRRGEDTDV
jgi:hypothetical protein